uniref:Serum amyloid A protein n=1 Tax=Rhinolophus ferrumequinum TaxID=59479 RepID=A0A671G6T8_RHIFE
MPKRRERAFISFYRKENEPGLGLRAALNPYSHSQTSMKDMWSAYSDMREANYKDSDRYFYACRNYDAAQKGPGGAWAAKVISNARENSQRVTDLFNYGDSGHEVEGTSGKDPNHFRPAVLTDKYCSPSSLCSQETGLRAQSH